MTKWADAIDVTIGVKSLCQALAAVTGAIERGGKERAAILSNVLLRSTDGSLVLRGTDLDLEIMMATACEVATEGAVTVNAAALSDLARKMPSDGVIRLRRSDEDPRLIVQCGRSRYQLPVLPAADFPKLSSDELPHRFEIDSDELARLIAKTSFAISTETSRYYLCGLYIAPATGEEGPALRAVSTDGHRMAVAESGALRSIPAFSGVIVPRKTVNEVRRLVDDAGEVTTVSLSDSKVQFQFSEGLMLSSKLIGGSFPDHARLFADKARTVLRAEKAPLAGIIDRALTLANNASRRVRIALEDGRLALDIRNSETAQGAEEMAVDWQFEPFDVLFNGSYLLDTLARVDAETVEVHFAGNNEPALFFDPADPRARFIVVPQGQPS